MYRSAKTGFLGTFNRLTGQAGGTTMDFEQVKRLILERLQSGPAGPDAFMELSVPKSMIEEAVKSLVELGLIVENKLTGGYALTDYARKALTYILPS